MRTTKVIIKKGLAFLAVAGAFHLLSYFPAQSLASQSISDAPLLMRYDKGDKAFSTKIFFKQAESDSNAEPSVSARILVNYYGG